MAKPSKIKIVHAKKTSLLLPNFRAITLFGTVYCASQTDVNLINYRDEIDSTLKSHETIHVRQAESTHDSWCLYYLIYIWQWICNLPLIFVNCNAPYKFIEMELEAYEHEDEWSYATKNQKCVGWKEYKKLTIGQKYKLAKEYYGEYKRKITFSEFVKKHVKPETKGK